MNQLLNDVALRRAKHEMAEYDAQIRAGGEPVYPQWAADVLKSDAQALIDSQRTQIDTDSAVLGIKRADHIAADQSGVDERAISLKLHGEIIEYLGRYGKENTSSLLLYSAAKQIKALAVAPSPAVAEPAANRLDLIALGRSEAVAMILQLCPEDALVECTRSEPNADAGDYSTYWDEKKLHAFFKTDDRTFSKMQEAEDEYWKQKILRQEAELQQPAATVGKAGDGLKDSLIDLVQDAVDEGYSRAIKDGAFPGEKDFIENLVSDWLRKFTAQQPAASDVRDADIHAAIKTVRAEERRIGRKVIGGDKTDVGLPLMVQALGFAIDRLEAVARQSAPAVQANGNPKGSADVEGV